MRIYKYKGSHTAYAITKKLVIIKNEKQNEIKFYFKGHGIANFKFYIRNKMILIRFPFFLFEKNNGGYKIGNSNCYLWIIK